jgi:hypothetical protein
MKAMRVSIVTALFLLGTSAANAISVPFSWDGGSISATGALALAVYNPTTGSAGSLGDGETSGSLHFGTVSVVGLGDGQLTVAVDFVAPDTNPASPGVTGPYSVASVFIFSSGKWSGGSTLFDYSYDGYVGMARLDFDAIDTGLQIGPKFDFFGTITNLGSRPAVQLVEPAVLVLFAIGLTVVAGFRRRELSKARA